MTTQYSRNVLKVVVAQICQTIGWHSINSTPLEFMVDLMQEYIFQLAKFSQQYAQVLGRSEANLDDLGLAFQHMNIDLQELTEYIKNVEPVPCVLSVPKLPIPRENHLNFLKPGSREVVTRPVHVHEHLPAMYPKAEEEYQIESKETEAIDTNAVNPVTNTLEDETSDNNNVITSNGTSSEDGSIKPNTQPVFKRPGDPVSFDGPIVKRAKVTEEGRPLREIHSVIMTTSGFLSTAREGKLPEARTPQQARSESPPPPSYPMVPPEVKVEKKVKKVSKKTEDGKPENKENKKKKIPKDVLFQPDEIKDVKVKKSGTKDGVKLKKAKAGTIANTAANLAGPSNLLVTGKVPGDSPKGLKNTLVANKLKTEKFDGISNIGNPLMNNQKEESIDKLPIEPDKQKLNIFKKISSKSKEDKERDLLDPHKLKETISSENNPHLVTDTEEKHRADVNLKQEDKKLIVPPNPQINNNVSRIPDDSVTNMMSPGSDGYMFDMSPPRTPSTPKTPELSVPSVAVVEQKKKRKEKSGKKKEAKLKTPKNTINPKKARLSNDSVTDLNVLDRPKTPQAPEQQQLPITPGSIVGTPRDPNMPSALPFPFFPAFSPAPGLIPHSMFPLAAAAAAKGIMPAMPVAPNPAAMMLNQRMFRPKLDGTRPPFVPPTFMNEPHHQQPLPLPQSPVFAPAKQQPQQLPTQLAKLKAARSPEKELHLPKPMIQPFQNITDMTQSLVNPAPFLVNPAAGVPAPLVPMIPPAMPAPLLPPPVLGAVKAPKLEKGEKKSKEHKKEKKDKLKKKKEKKEKHKDKGEKIKEKKDKSEKKEKLEKIKEKKEKKEKKKEKEKEKEAIKKLAKEEKAIESVPKITLKLGPAGGSPRPATPENSLKKITIKPPKKPEDEAVKREPTPELARISALVTRPPKQKSTKAKAEAVPKKDGTKEDKENGEIALTTNTAVTVDASGRTVWICPACGKQDDGSPMIGCDDCDAWYHWVCVGIQVAPADNEDWYCRMCIAKKQEQYQDKKKKKRKKKMKLNA